MSIAVVALPFDAAVAAEDVIVSEFEATDFGAWKATGSAFGAGPAQGAVDGQMEVDGFEGKGFCNSFHGGDDATGTLVSPSFKIERKTLKFLIGGGGFASKTCVNLSVDGKVVRSATGPNTRPGGSEDLHWQSWDVSEFNGRMAVMEIVDQATGGWGHVNVDQIMQSDTLPPSAQEQFIKDAGKFVDSRALIAAKDPLRPIYHVMPKSQSTGDPNGPVFFNGEYHVFFQHFPYWGTNRKGFVWGHAVSKDMVHWKNLPIALAPEPNSYDSVGIASGGCVIHNGVPTIIYTGFDSRVFGRDSGQSQCIATSTDNLRTWKKDPVNPVIPNPPPIIGLASGFRDPFVWQEGKEWRMLVGCGYDKGKGGVVMLYRSMDLRNWEFLGPLCEGMGEQCFQWECPTFFPLGNRHVLIVSPLFRNVPGLRAPTQSSVGAYRNNRFEQGEWQPVDLGGATAYYAATSFEDPKKRRILWGFLMTPQGPATGWGNCLSLPRVLSTGPDSSLHCAPLPELSALRTKERDAGNPVLKPGEEVVLDPAVGLHGEVAIEIDMKDAERIELRIGRTSDGRDYVPLSFDKAAGSLTFGNKKADFRLDADNRLRIRLFTDGAVAEAFLNEKACFSHALPVTEKSVGLSIVAASGNPRVIRCRVWEMNSIW